MSKNVRTPRADIVDVLSAIDVKQEHSLSPLDEHRVPPHRTEGPRGAVYASGDDPARPRECGLTLLSLRHG